MKKILIFLFILFFSIEFSFAYSDFEGCVGDPDFGPQDYLKNMLHKDKYYFNSTDLILSQENSCPYSVQVLHDGKPVNSNQEVMFFINGVNYTRLTDSDGIATLNINLNPGHYIVYSEYKNFRNYNNILVVN